MSGSGFFYTGSTDRSTALGDFNGDGKLDLVTLDTGSDGHLAEVLPGNGDGTFGTPIVALAGTSGLGTGASALRVADMNRDGKPDVIVTSGPAGVQGNQGTTATRIAYGVGNGAFTYAAELPPGDPNWTIPNVVVADFNQDGVPDLAVLTVHGFDGGTQKRQQHVEVFIQNPNQAGAFTRTAGFPQTDLGESNGDGIVAGDFDGDGKTDVIAGGGGTSSSAPDQVMFLKGKGDGTFQPAVAAGTIPVPQVVRLSDLRAADVNNDGKLDLIGAGFNGISVFLGNGNGNFQPPVFYPSGGGGSAAMDIADLDGDGNLDVALGIGGGGFTVLRGRSDGTFSAPIYFGIGYYTGKSVRTGDLNGDSKPDVVVGHDIGGSQENIFATVLLNNTATVQFSSATFGVNEGAGTATITVTRVGDTSATATVDYATIGTAFVPCNAVSGVASQNCDYLTASGTLTFAPGEVSKTFTVLIVDDLYVEGNEVLSLNLSNPTGMVLGSPGTAVLTITDNDTASPTTSPLDDPQFFVRQHYYDFLSRLPDEGGLAYWTARITDCGADQSCIHNRRIDVSNAFFYELEFQQTGAYVFRLYRASYGNNQPAPNPDHSKPAESAKLPSYAVFVQDRARVVAGTNLAQSQLALANIMVQRPEFLLRYAPSLSGAQFVDALLSNINGASGVNLNSQRAALINLFTQGGRGLVLYRVADDNVQTNPIDNRSFVDAEYNRAFVYTQYAGYLRRDSDIDGFLFWLAQVNTSPVRDASKQHSMVCAFITSREYQERLSPVVTRSNADCGRF
jgi:hypothetical protein